MTRLTEARGQTPVVQHFKWHNGEPCPCAWPAALAADVAPEPDAREAVGALVQRIERHVDFECGAAGRYAFMEEVRVLFGPLVPRGEQARD